MTELEHKHTPESGVSHWKAQRRSALVLVPLSLWLLYSLINHIGISHDLAYSWVSRPLVASLLSVFIIALFYHAKLGLQLIIEDYIADLSGRQSIIRISNLLCWIAIFVGVASILKIALNV